MIGNTLRLLRRIHGKTIKELSNELGVSSSFISAIEHNKRNPSLSLLEKYADSFGIRLNGLLFFYEEIRDDDSKGFFEKNSRPLFLKAIKTLEKITEHESQE